MLDRIQEPRPYLGAPAPLFDRLIDRDPEDPTPPPKIYSKEQHLLSIQRELGRLLNTRVAKRASDEWPLTKLYRGLPQLYGLPDLSLSQPSNLIGRQEIAKWCEKVIALYEPRIHTPQVSAGEWDPKKQRLTLLIGGQIQLGNFLEAINFSLDLDHFS